MICEMFQRFLKFGVESPPARIVSNNYRTWTIDQLGENKEVKIEIIVKVKKTLKYIN